MELIDQHTKKIMEGCKERAKDAGLKFQEQSLEYIVTNRDLLELTPKLMVPTLYDYWIQDLEVLKEKGKYELYPFNPYETVINTRPAISFYNDNNPDWLNVMIFYHVLAHIDFFQNNLHFKHTWDYDFNGQALSDKRMIARLRSSKGRWVDYVIEFTRGIDNLAGYYATLRQVNPSPVKTTSVKVDYYFDIFLQKEKNISIAKYIKEIERYNTCQKKFKARAEEQFFSGVNKKHPEFEAVYRKYLKQKKPPVDDLIQFILENSQFLKKEENQWMKSVMEIIRKTSLFFQPQIRTKIMNEGWASYWHEKLFLMDDRINGHEVDFARVHAGITAIPKVGLNPYALGMRLFEYIEDLINKGKYSIEFKRLLDANKRKKFDSHTGKGLDFIFNIRENYCDFTFINSFLDQDFVNLHKLFVTEKRLNQNRMVWEYYIKSRDYREFRQMLINNLYHPPYISIDTSKIKTNTLYLNHLFEEKPLIKEFISNTLLGMEYLWGGPVQLETSEVEAISSSKSMPPSPTRAAVKVQNKEKKPPEIKWKRVLYTMKDKRLTRKIL
jgi:stage V sporulation protein R